MIKRPKYQHLETEETVIVSIDVNRWKLILIVVISIHFQCFFIAPNALTFIFSSSTSKTPLRRAEKGCSKSGSSLSKVLHLPRATKMSYVSDWNTLQLVLFSGMIKLPWKIVYVLRHCHHTVIQTMKENAKNENCEVPYIYFSSKEKMLQINAQKTISFDWINHVLKKC